jgi:hypothetical protein
MDFQIRRYKIVADGMDEFVELFNDQLVPLRERFGFRLESSWRLDETHEFMWIVSHDGAEGFEAADAAYYSSPDRDALSPNPLDFIEEVNTSMATRLAP